MAARYALPLIAVPAFLLAGCAATPAGVDALDTGESIPSEVAVRTPAGERLDLNTAIARKPALLVFYRGSWCKYCRMQLRDLKYATPQIEEMGYQVAALSPDKPENIAETVAELDPPFDIYSDSAMHAAEAFGVAYRLDDALYKKYKEDFGIDLERASGQAHHKLPVPSVFILDTDGVVRYAHTEKDYTQRLDQDALEAAARRTKDEVGPE